jgi:hypothetical protein
MNPPAHTRRGRAALGGAASGLVAGLVLTLMMTAMSLAKGNDVWYGIKGTAAPFLGERAMEPGFEFLAVWLGLVLHLAISVAWAVPFAFLFYGLGRWSTLLAGAAWGIVVWLGMFYVVLPAVGLEQMQREAPIARAILYHVFFGLAVAVAFLGFQHAEASRFRRWRAAYGT